MEGPNHILKAEEVHSTDQSQISDHQANIDALNNDEMSIRSQVHRIVRDLKQEMKKLGRMSAKDLKEFSKAAIREINHLIRECGSLSHKKYFRKQGIKLHRLKDQLLGIIRDTKSRSRSRSKGLNRKMKTIQLSMPKKMGVTHRRSMSRHTQRVKRSISRSSRSNSSRKPVAASSVRLSCRPRSSRSLASRFTK